MFNEFLMENNQNNNNTYYHAPAMRSVTSDIEGGEPLPEIIPSDMLHEIFARYLESILNERSGGLFYVYNVGEDLNPSFYGFEDTSHIPCVRVGNYYQQVGDCSDNSIYRFIFTLSNQRWSLFYITPGRSTQCLIENVTLDEAGFSYLLHKDNMDRNRNVDNTC